MVSDRPSKPPTMSTPFTWCERRAGSADCGPRLALRSLFVRAKTICPDMIVCEQPNKHASCQGVRASGLSGLILRSGSSEPGKHIRADECPELRQIPVIAGACVMISAARCNIDSNIIEILQRQEDSEIQG